MRGGSNSSPHFARSCFESELERQIGSRLKNGRGFEQKLQRQAVAHTGRLHRSRMLTADAQDLMLQAHFATGYFRSRPIPPRQNLQWFSQKGRGAPVLNTRYCRPSIASRSPAWKQCSNRICCAPAPCWKIRSACAGWWRRAAPSARITRVRRARRSCAAKPLLTRRAGKRRRTGSGTAADAAPAAGKMCDGWRLIKFLRMPQRMGAWSRWKGFPLWRCFLWSWRSAPSSALIHLMLVLLLV